MSDGAYQHVALWMEDIEESMYQKKSAMKNTQLLQTESKNYHFGKQVKFFMIKGPK